MADLSGVRPYPYLLLPSLWASRNRARRRERGDVPRAVLFGGIAVLVAGAIAWGAYWVTAQLAFYAELGDYLIRLGLAWLFLTFLSFLAFSSIVTSLSTFFLADDLRLLLAAPVDARRLFHARFARTLAQASWMVVVFLTPVLAGVGAARSAPPAYYVTAVLTVAPFVTIPVAFGAVITLGLVNVFPARRAREVLMLLGLVFATSIVLLLRFIGSLEHSAEAQAAYAVAYTELFSLVTWTSVGLMGAAAAVLLLVGGTSVGVLSPGFGNGTKANPLSRKLLATVCFYIAVALLVPRGTIAD